MVNRLKSYWEGDPRAGWVDAVLASDDRLGQLRDRLGQLLEKTRDPGWPAYVEATIRIARVLKEPVAPQIREGYSTAAEEELARAARGLGRAPDLASWWTKAVPAAVEAVARLFDDVLVMDPDSSVRAARLALLAAAGQGLTRFWDPVRGG
jgi:glycyl-tRNA synthetase beta subunit